MQQQVAQQPEMKKEGKVAKYIRWVLCMAGIAFIVVILIAAIYRKFGG